MMNTGISKKPSTSSPLKTQQIVNRLRSLPAGWGGTLEYKKPAARAVKKLEKLLSRLESGFMPWPSIAAIANGSIIATWLSLNKDITLTIDQDGDIQFVTSLKQLDFQTLEVMDRLDSEGAITDMAAIDHLMAWYSKDSSSHC
jgi:hypothetical protein